VPNPEYSNAPYELSYQFADGKPAPIGFVPLRFKASWPDHFANSNEMSEWVRKNSIPTHIEVETNS
jgi:hypothetical protein